MGSSLMDLPSIVIWPSSKSIMPQIDLIRVVLPAPLWPIKAKISPASTLKETLSRAFLSP